MVYGVLQLINFAHGDVFMLGAMMGWYASSVWTSESRNPSIAGALAVTLFSMLVCAAVGLLIERLAYRPLRGSPRLNALITAIGVSFFLGYGGAPPFRPPPPALRGFSPPPRPGVPGISLRGVDLVSTLPTPALVGVLPRISSPPRT